MTPPTVDDAPRPAPTFRQRRIDLGIALAIATIAVLNVFLARSAGLFASDSAPSVIEQLGWSLAVMLPLIWRRSRPEVVAVLVSIFFIGGQVRGAQEQQLATGAVFVAIYTLGAWGRDRRRSRRLRLAIIAGMFAWLAVAFILSHDEITTDGTSGELPPLLAAVLNAIIVNVAFFGFAYALGEAARRQWQLEVRTAELRAAQAVAGERAVIGERVRIARELHDVVAHHVSVMGIQASACRRVMDKDPDRARTALTAVEDSARTAVDELRRMLGALRDTGGAGDEPPTGADLDRVDDLIARAREAGLTATCDVYGDPVPLPGSVSQAAYRIVQEAVTNTLKHAHATTLDVRIRYLAGELELDVADDGRGAVPGAGGGLGLIGMRERVAVHDGVLETGARSGGGFRVRARLPLSRELTGAGEQR
ncbi:two-component sensor histidine kinase [Actinoplanes sp. ATCC 53533]|uniref:sensor histidine kinase n=1 Tax=Actinoplanes sp. ATCC 53533 TaxID=1288362 RepID=UPI000F7805C6|nr:sensor histidine kinase [Actinoplanes sp. ATCC 53533]RSM59528.1 two-component sensor histidine kinase [Actinoplanes sp. ATCC 53533]